MSLSREALLKPVPIQKVKVELPELGGHVWVHGMNCRERTEFTRQFNTGKDAVDQKRKAELSRRLVVATCFDDNGTRIFTKSDVDALGDQDSGLIEKLAEAAQSLMDGKDEDTEGNSEEASETS